MSKDWIDEEPTDETAAEGDGEAPAPEGRRGGGGRVKLSLGTVVALGLILVFKGGRLYDRFWPHAQQEVHADVLQPLVPAKGTLTITRVQATRPTPPTSGGAEAMSKPLVIAPRPVFHPAPAPATRPAPVALAMATPAPAAPAPATRPAIPDPFGTSAAAAPSVQQQSRLAQTTALLSTLRAQLGLYTTHHGGKSPDFAKYAAWHQLTHKTRADGVPNAAGEYGPYLDAAPVNPLNDSGVIGLTGRIPKPGQTLRTPSKLGWVYCITTQSLYATDTDGKTILDERKAAAR